MSKPRGTVLLVDDEAAVRFGMREYLAEQGFEILEADGVQAGLRVLAEEAPDLTVLDYRLDDGTALDLLAELRRTGADVPTVVLTAHGSIDLAVRTVKEGAEQFLTKPVEMSALLAIIERLIEERRARRHRVATRAREARTQVSPFTGVSDAIRELAQQAQRVAESDVTVLLMGETGSGKGVLARWLHGASERSAEPYVDINGAGLSPTFLESELFGHEKGAFTGATKRKEGLFEVANRGTLFLDEVGEIDLEVQPKLLKVLEERSFRRLGATQSRRVDVRLIAASHRDLRELVDLERFRPDLFYRIATVVLHIPPLRDRPEDIPPLLEHLISALARRRAGKPEPQLSPAAVRDLQAYPWPGNIRELRNVLERAMLMAPSEEIQPADLALRRAETGAQTASPTDTLEEVERRHIAAVLRAQDGHVLAAAKVLGVPKSTLYQKLKRHGIKTS